jgi:hypothetical protein
LKACPTATIKLAEQKISADTSSTQAYKCQLPSFLESFIASPLQLIHYVTMVHSLIGKPAPTFSAMNTNGETYDFTTGGGVPTVLFFYPKAGTSLSMHFG